MVLALYIPRDSYVTFQTMLFLGDYEINVGHTRLTVWRLFRSFDNAMEAISSVLCMPIYVI